MPKLLLADDSAFMRQILRGFFEEAGYEVADLAPGSALEVLEKAKTWLPDLVITDYQMPHIKGDVVAKMVRRGRPDATIVAFTANQAPEVVNILKSAGVDHILYKPMKAEAVVEQVQAFLASRG